MKSITRRLLLGTTAAVALVLVLAGSSLYALVERSLVAEADRALLARARTLSTLVEQNGDELSLEFVNVDGSVPRDDEPGDFIQLSLARGDVLYRSPLLGETKLDIGAWTSVPVVAWAVLPSGVRARRVSYFFEPAPADPTDALAKPAKLALVLARELRDVDRSLATLRVLLVSVGLATLAVAAVVLVWVVRRSVRPVVEVATRLAAIGEDDLSTRLEPSGVPTELVPVVERANELLARLDAAFARERAFANDLAHELRTPLAGLRATLEVALTRRRSEAEYAGAIVDCARIVGQMQAMVERLLQLARLDAGTLAPRSRPYDPAELALEAWEPFAAPAQARGLCVDLRLENGPEVTLSRELVGSILRNLYDNAVTYSDSGGRMSIALRRSATREIGLEVSNSGSRLDQDQALAATRRFWRGDAARAESGLHCGLGLALVDKATQALGGELQLTAAAGGDFIARVRLPGDSPRSGAREPEAQLKNGLTLGSLPTA